MPTRLCNQSVTEQQQRRQQQQHDHHADERAPCQKHAERANQIDVRTDTHADGGGKETERARQNRRDGHGERRVGRLSFFHTEGTLRLVTVRKQYGVIHRGAELNRTDDNRGDEGEGCPRVKRKPHVNIYRKLNDKHEQNRQRDGVEHEQDNHKDGGDGNNADHLEIPVRNRNQIIRAGCLAKEHPLGVIFFQNLPELRELVVHLIRGDFIFRSDEHELSAAALQKSGDFFRQKLLRNLRSQNGIQTERKLHAVHVLHFLQHVCGIFCGQIAVRQNQVHRAHIEALRKLRRRLTAGQRFRHTGSQVIVNVHMRVADERRNPQHQQNHGQHNRMPHDPAGKFRGIDRERPVHGFANRLIAEENQRRQHRDAANHTQHNPFGHNDTQVETQRKRHKAERQKACNRGQG